MARGRRKKVIVQKNTSEDDRYSFRTRRSSMRVNLSYVSNLSDSGHGSLKRANTESDENASAESSVQDDDLSITVKKCKTKGLSVNDDTATPASVANITVISANNRCFPSDNKELEEAESNSLTIIKEKEQQLNRSCLQLKDAIMHKTQALFDKENELAIKTTEVLAPGYMSPENQIDEEANDQRSPSIRVNIGKNDQIIMSGDGRKRNPVQVNSMREHHSRERECNVSLENADDDSMDCNQSIVSTPKKSRTESDASGKEPCNKASETILRIPVARLFVDDDDPNNSMSEVNQLNVVNSPKRTDTSSNETDRSNVSNSSRISNELNYTSSPILSQGTRRSRLSLKKKLTKNTAQNSLRLSSSSTNESFVNKIPLTCSSYIERQDKTCNENEADKHCGTINLDEKSESDNNCKTINLDDNETIGKTIVVENSTTQSSMEITTISSHVPIIHRSFQQIIRKSLNLDSIKHDGNVSYNTLIQKQAPPVTNQNKNVNKEVNNIKPIEQAESNNIYQEDCTANTVRTSLNVNTSLDQINLGDNTVQKENRKPNSLQTPGNNNDINQIGENDTIIIQRQSTYSVRSSMQVNTSLDSVRKSSIPNISNQEQEISNKIVLQQPTASSNEEKENSNSMVIQNPSTNSNQETESSIRVSSRKSSISSIQGKENSNCTVPSKQLSLSSNQEKEGSKKIASRQPSTSTVRSSMQVNTSLDSVQKSPITKTVLDFNKMLSVVEETLFNNNQSKTNLYSSKNQSLDSDSELENVSLMERLRNISGTKKTDILKEPNQDVVSTKRKSTEIENDNTNETKISTGVENTNASLKRKTIEIENTNKRTTRKSTEIQNTSKKTTKKSNGTENTNLNVTRKSIEVQNISSSTDDPSIIEATPYPTSRSVLLKTIIKNNIAMNTLDPKKFIDFSDNEDSNQELHTIIQKNNSPNKYQSIYARKKTLSPNLLDTVVLNSSDESSNESDKGREPVIIEDSLNETKGPNMSKNDKESDDEQKDKKVAAKRKLYPLRENSQLISFSPSEIQEPPKQVEPTTIKKKQKRKVTQKKRQENKVAEKIPETNSECEPMENEMISTKVEKTKKKPRKIVRKKIIIKKVANMTFLDNMLHKEDERSQRLSERNSLREFDLRRIKGQRNENTRKSHKIIIVVTGLSKEDKDLVKSVIKTLGSAALEVNVTPRTTHVISTGVRTINLLKGIIRGCWLLNLEWALKSLESGKWLDPSPYEMSHFSKAVQENRRDRQLFGKAYVPELFVTCGLIYIEHGTSPPASVLKELIKTAGGRITEDPNQAEIVVGLEGLKEIWILDAITTGEIQPLDQYKRN